MMTFFFLYWFRTWRVLLSRLVTAALQALGP